LPNAVQALCDSGPLVALFDPRDPDHIQSRAALESFEGRLLTTWPVLTEVFHFLNTRQQGHVWGFVFSGGLSIVDVLEIDLPRLRDLMAKYADLPMDVADGSLVVVAERLGLRMIFSLDRHFLVYRPRHAPAFEVMT